MCEWMYGGGAVSPGDRLECMYSAETMPTGTDEGGLGRRGASKAGLSFKEGYGRCIAYGEVSESLMGGSRV